MAVRQKSQNILILKDDVGKSRRSTRDLPKTNFIYGRPIERDEFNV